MKTCSTSQTLSFIDKLFGKKEKETLNEGLAKTKESFFGKLAKAIAGKSTVDADVLDNLEDVLITGDVGVNTTLKIIKRIEARVASKKYVGTSELNNVLKGSNSKHVTSGLALGSRVMPLLDAYSFILAIQLPKN